MGKTTVTDPVKREVGEKIKLTLGFDSASTKDLGDGVLEAIITTNSVDRHRERIETSGIDTSGFMNNPVVLYGHDYEGLPIGKALKLTEMKNKIKARFQLAVNEYPFAATVYEMIKAGYLNAISIGGIVRKWSEDYDVIEEMEMVEFSVVPVPANPEALITSRSLEAAAGKSEKEVRQEYQDFSRKVLLDKLDGMGEDELKDAIKGLKIVMARLDDSVAALPSSTDAKSKKIKLTYVLRDAKAVVAHSNKVTRTIKVTLKKED